MIDLKGRVAIITGGGSGMGRATALEFARAGADVVIADIDGVGANETARLISEEGGSASPFGVDVTEAPQVEAMVEHAVALYGRLDCAVNNAAIKPDDGGILGASVEQWDKIISVDLSAVMLCLKFEIAQMLGQSPAGGAIVNVGSIRSHRGRLGSPAYTAAKHGVIGLTRAAALEYGKAGIRVNAVCPGPIETPMSLASRAQRGETSEEARSRVEQSTLLGRFGTAEEIAQVHLWLCSSASSFITGQSITADGGYLEK
jgi:NAD(P)-dependent dehydrogenase (short-subunit alcohol dehydrogenase family)